MPPLKRRLSANLLNPSSNEQALISAGTGGAWRAGLQADRRHDVDDLLKKQAQDILEGRQALLLDPEQVIDRVGTDRRADWQDQPAYLELRDSIEKYGQDTPIEVWPMAPDWQPPKKAPFVAESDRFELVTGRRRRLAAADLGLQVRAVILPRHHEPDAHHWQVLLRRYRENNHRANLSPFEKMLSIAEMHDAWRQTVSPSSIRQFAGAIGVDPSYVSRAIRLSKSEKELCRQYDDPYSLGYRELEKWIINNSETQKGKASAKRASKAHTTLNIAGRRIEWKQSGDKLTLVIPGVADDISSEQFSSLIERLIKDLTAGAS